ncbi:MAG: carboxypeptidase regulatory-like domain-containing protein [Holophagaceae bacterium]|nr:carboxypeptidase regulatory-like domain-containing protein [Holophagaceae bacterium]
MKLSHLTSLGLMLASVSLIAQESTGVLLGTVRDESGNPIAGATVTITSSVLLQPRTIPTNANGEYRAQMLPPGGGYTLTVSHTGLLTRRVGGLTVRSGVTARQDIVLRSADVATTTIDIVGMSAAVDKTETKVSTSFSFDEIEALVAPSLNAWGALAMSPGVAGNITYPVIRGAITGQSQFLVNGVSVRDSLVREGRQDESVIADIIEDIQVIQSPLNAKYGFTSGGIVNVVTKTGGNEFHGGVRIKLENDLWAARTHDTAPRVPHRTRVGLPQSFASEPYEDLLWKTYELNFRGPIWKDHITFTYAGRFIPETTGSAGVVNLFSSGTPRPYNPYFGKGELGFTYGQVDMTPGYIYGVDKLLTQNYKLFWQITPSQTLSFEATVDKSDYFDDQLSGNIDVENGRYLQRAPTDNRVIQYNAIFGNFVVDLRWGTHNTDVEFSFGPGDPIYHGTYSADAEHFFDRRPSANSNWWQGSVLTNGDRGDGIPEHRNTAMLDANVQWMKNNHQLDFGFAQFQDIVRGGGYPGINGATYYVPGRVADGRYVVWNVTGTYDDPLQGGSSPTDALWRTAARIPRVDVVSTTGSRYADNEFTTQAVYVNDLYTINEKWSVMAGLRFEKYIYDSKLGKEIDNSDILPRLSVKYDLFGDNQHVFDLSYGHFRGTIGPGTLGGFMRSPNNRSVNYFWSAGQLGTPLGDGVPYLVSKEELLNLNNYTPYNYVDSELGRLISPDIMPEMRTSITINYSRAFTTGYFRVAAIFDKFSDIPYISIPEWTIKYTPDFPNTGMENIAPYVDRYFSIDPYGKRDYTALEAEWQQRLFGTAKSNLTWAGNWTMARIKGTRQWKEGNVGDNAAYYYEQWDKAGVRREAWNPYGELDGVSEHHNIKSWLTYHVGDRTGVQTDLTFMASYVTGRPYNQTANIRLPDELYSQAQLYTVLNYARYAAFYYNDSRGWFLNQDGPPSFDLKWNMNMPLGKISLFSSVSIFNVFNHYSRTGLGRSVQAGDIFTSEGIFDFDPSAPNYGMPTGPYQAIWGDANAYNKTKGWAAGNQGRYSRGGWSYNQRYIYVDFGFRF